LCCCLGVTLFVHAVNSFIDLDQTDIGELLCDHIFVNHHQQLASHTGYLLFAELNSLRVRTFARFHL
jgi:hypothetical protein